MNKLIFLNRSINCGKTTIGNKLLEICGSIAFVEIDALHGFITWMPIENAVPLNIKNGIDVTRKFTYASSDVIFAYPLSDVGQNCSSFIHLLKPYSSIYINYIRRYFC